MTYKIYKRSSSGSRPRLVAVRQLTKPKNQVGFLDVYKSDKRIEVGMTGSKEFLLVQCLFSPQNFLGAKYNPVAQTYERISRMMGISGTEHTIRGAVKNSIRTLQKQEVGNYLTFTYGEETMRMEVTQKLNLQTS